MVKRMKKQPTIFRITIQGIVCHKNQVLYTATSDNQSFDVATISPIWFKETKKRYGGIFRVTFGKRKGGKRYYAGV